MDNFSKSVRMTNYDYVKQDDGNVSQRIGNEDKVKESSRESDDGEINNDDDGEMLEDVAETDTVNYN